MRIPREAAWVSSLWTSKAMTASSSLCSRSLLVPSTITTSSANGSCTSRRTLVSLYGHPTQLSPGQDRRRRRKRSGGLHVVTGEKPPDPYALSTEQFQSALEALIAWWTPKQQVLCLTGAGLSTESGIPDYRGHQGSYHKGHKPMVHDQFMKHEHQRKRYWGRGMVGWKPFEAVEPNVGHVALAELEHMGYLGVYVEDQPTFYDAQGLELEWPFTSGQRKLSLITQNVDSLHRRAGSQEIIELHGTSGRVQCMNCGTYRDRYDFHDELERINREWLDAALEAVEQDDLRADGDAAVHTESFEEVLVPPCEDCGHFVKPDVVFFGDSVPKHRVRLCEAAVEQCDGLLVVGSSLAVHSAFRHVKAACQRGTPVAILNVGETRAEIEELPGITKLEAPAGATLEGLVQHFRQEKDNDTTNKQFTANVKDDPMIANVKA